MAVLRWHLNPDETIFLKIGEKGINLSGGQKQRVCNGSILFVPPLTFTFQVNIARALYYDADIVILDDPLSAGTYYCDFPFDLTESREVDAHVGKSLFHDAILGSLRQSGKSVILVTHALHFLIHCDYIYTMQDGHIAEQGTYQELVAKQGEFARLDKEFGGSTAHSTEVQTKTAREITVEEVRVKSENAIQRGAGNGKLEGKLMVKERRSTGSVSWKSKFI